MAWTKEVRRSTRQELRTSVSALLPRRRPNPARVLATWQVGCSMSAVAGRDPSDAGTLSQFAPAAAL